MGVYGHYLLLEHEDYPERSLLVGLPSRDLWRWLLQGEGLLPPRSQEVAVAQAYTACPSGRAHLLAQHPEAVAIPLPPVTSGKSLLKVVHCLTRSAPLCHVLLRPSLLTAATVVA